MLARQEHGSHLYFLLLLKFYNRVFLQNKFLCITTYLKLYCVHTQPTVFLAHSLHIFRLKSIKHFTTTETLLLSIANRILNCRNLLNAKEIAIKNKATVMKQYHNCTAFVTIFD